MKILSPSLLMALPLFASQAIAAPIPLTDWGIDLSGLNTTTVGATTYDNLGSLSGLQDISIAGSSTVVQELDGAGSSVGEIFTESGYLSWIGAKVFPSGSSLSPALFGSFLGTNDAAGSGVNGIYFEWIDLTGTTGVGGDISFDTDLAQTGSMSLYLDLDGMDLASVGSGVGERLALATFDIVPLSGGSGIGTDGGAFPSGTVGLTMQFATINPHVVFTDSLGATLDPDTLFQFIDIDATLSDPAAFCTGAGGTGVCSTDSNVVNPGTALSFISTPINHEGSTVIAAVPEPNALMLLAASLLSVGGIARKKK